MKNRFFIRNCIYILQYIKYNKVLIFFKQMVFLPSDGASLPAIEIFYILGLYFKFTCSNREN